MYYTKNLWNTKYKSYHENGKIYTYAELNEKYNNTEVSTLDKKGKYLRKEQLNFLVSNFIPALIEDILMNYSKILKVYNYDLSKLAEKIYDYIKVCSKNDIANFYFTYIDIIPNIHIGDTKDVDFNYFMKYTRKQMAEHIAFKAEYIWSYIYMQEDIIRKAWDKERNYSIIFSERAMSNFNHSGTSKDYKSIILEECADNLDLLFKPTLITSDYFVDFQSPCFVSTNLHAYPYEDRYDLYFVCHDIKNKKYSANHVLIFVDEQDTLDDIEITKYLHKKKFNFVSALKCFLDNNVPCTIVRVPVDSKKDYEYYTAESFLNLFEN